MATIGDGVRVVAGQFGLRPTWLTGSNTRLPVGIEPAISHLTVPYDSYSVAAGVAAWRQRRFEAARLVVIVLAAAALGVVAVARTVKPVYAYRLRWTWVLGMLGVLTIAWTAWLLLSPHYQQANRRRLTGLAIAALLGLAVVNVSSATHAFTPWKTDSATVTKLVNETVAALPNRSGDVIVRSADIPSVMYQGVQLALERRGIPARTDDPTDMVGNGSEHRVHRRGKVRAILTVATLDGIKQTFGVRNQHLIAYDGPVSEHRPRFIEFRRLTLKRQYEKGAISAEEAFLQTVALGKPLHGPEVVIFMLEPKSSTRSTSEHPPVPRTPA